MVKSDPFSGLRYVGGFMVIGGIGGAIWVAVVRGGDIGSIVALLVMALCGAAIFWRLFPWAPVEQRRQAAARQENTIVSLAAEQPVPDELALPLPWTIKLRPKWTTGFLFWGPLILLISVPLLLSVWMNPPQPDYAVPAMIGVSVGAAALLAFTFPLLGWHSIKVTEKGVKAQEGSILSIGCNLRTIEWSEARLFAIYPTRNRSDPPRFYELVGANAIVRWRRVRPGDALRLTKPPTSFEDYDRQIEALLALIAAKTGLPLYDLRG